MPSARVATCKALQARVAVAGGRCAPGGSEGADKEVQELRDEVTRLRSELTQAKDNESADADVRVDAGAEESPLQEARDALAAEKERLRKMSERCKKLRARTKELQTGLASFRKKYKDAQAKLDSVSAAGPASVDTSSGDTKTSNDEAQAAPPKIVDELKAKVAELTSQAEELKAKATKAEKKFRRCFAAQAALAEDSEVVEEENLKLKQQVDDLLREARSADRETQRASALEKELKAVRAELDAAKGRHRPHQNNSPNLQRRKIATVKENKGIR